MKKAWMVIPIIISITHFCGTGEEKLDLNTFSQTYSKIQQEFKKEMNQPEAKKKIGEILQKKNRELEKLLTRSKSVPDSEEREIIKSKILIHLKRYPEAEKTIDPVLESKGGFANGARMVKTQILLARGKMDQALKIFREIEGKIPRDEDFFSTSLYFALKSTDLPLREEYCNKLLTAEDFPAEFKAFKARLYASLAAVRYENNQLDESKDLMKKAIGQTGNPLEKYILTSQLSQLELIGNPAPPMTAETWINSTPIPFYQMRGKKIILYFWAPWCEPCREVLPLLAEFYNGAGQKDLVLIGVTKLYGMYRDGQINRGKLEKPEEISLIEEFIQKQKITFPIAISHQGDQYEKYFVTGIPVMVFINPSGTITHIQMGSLPPDRIKKQIKAFLEK